MKKFDSLFDMLMIISAYILAAIGLLFAAGMFVGLLRLFFGG